MAQLGLNPRLVVLLRHIGAAEGSSQQTIGQAMQVPPPSMVALVDDLEEQRLIERRPDPKDRRVNHLYLTSGGHQALRKVMKVSAEHEAELCAGLAPAEREQLIELLSRLAEQQGLAEGVHPGVVSTPERTSTQ
ncbi:MAG TPA: MarR family winged helix-turn-helix transcriptional regulator [Acidimicrobiia bacterium]|jgi:DNA-binding MarR family transcriptional regulator|nr:MarR family winged helix-turn-helix transcriptional regulator [Acidimicrobiia bacterium]